MRQVPLRWWVCRVVVVVIAAAAVTAAPATAATTAPLSVLIDTKLDASLQTALSSPLATPFTPMRVIAAGHAERARATASFQLYRDLDVVEGDSLKITAAELLKLLRSQEISFVAADAPMQVTASGSGSAGTAAVDSALATLYPNVVGAPAAWARGLRGEGLGIAVVDSGATQHADLGTRLVTVPFGTQTTAPPDTVGHGTFVSAVAGGSSADGRYKGIAPGATIYSLNVSRSDGVYTSDVIAALDWVLANGRTHNIRVVNLSLNEAVESSYLTNMLDTAVERLWHNGIVVVVSSGNRGPDSASHAPANDPFAITVGALDVSGTLDESDDVIPSWSSSGRTLDGYDKPELVAPGRQIVAPLPANTTLAAQGAFLTNVVAARLRRDERHVVLSAAGRGGRGDRAPAEPRIHAEPGQVAPHRALTLGLREHAQARSGAGRRVHRHSRFGQPRREAFDLRTGRRERRGARCGGDMGCRSDVERSRHLERRRNLERRGHVERGCNLELVRRLGLSGRQWMPPASTR